MITLIGRKNEVETIKDAIQSNESEFICVYGRRRVGKTFLINETFNYDFDFNYTGTYKTKNKMQLKNFSAKLNSDVKVEDWFDAFKQLKKYLLSLNKEKVNVFLDEIPWMAIKNSYFVQALGQFWNDWVHDNKEKVILKLAVCGSAASWMVNSFIGDKGGLYGRLTRKIYLRPFNLYETKEYLTINKSFNTSNIEILNYYKVLGGIPYYLSLLEKEKTFNQNIDNLFFNDNALLKNEYEFLFSSLFDSSTYYCKVVEAISNKLYGVAREEIAKAVKLENGNLTKILNDLINCDFIKSITSFNKKERNKIYILSDQFTLFYYKFIKGNYPNNNYWSNSRNQGQINAWNGYSFEQICFSHINQIKSALGISGVSSRIFSWRQNRFTDENGTEHSGGQIDLIIDRDDKIVNLCEIKFTSNSTYDLTEKYLDEVMKRNDEFINTTKSKKSPRCTFITTFGISNRANYNYVDNIITLENLFEK